MVLAVTVLLAIRPGTLSARSLHQEVRAEVVTVLNQLRRTNDARRAHERATELFDRVVLYAPDEQIEVFRSAAFLKRLTGHMADLPDDLRARMVPFLLDSERLAMEMAFAVKPEHQEPAAVYAVLDRLRSHRGDLLNQYATLAASIAVVHDRPFERRVNENRPGAPDPRLIFDFHTTHEGQMLYGIRNMPTELMIYIVDTTLSREEMLWAMRRHRGHEHIGELYFDISYDDDHVRLGTPKRVTQAGFSLENILNYGGVCADQAYYAMSIGKSIGVPTAYVRGRSANVSHAWVGFLQVQGRRAQWNFDAGRYEAYRGVRGELLDPQTRQWIPDAHLSLVAQFVASETASRQAAAGLTDAARRLRELSEEDIESLRPPGRSSGDKPRKPVRTATLEAQLDLIERALRTSAGYAPAWFEIRDLASGRQLSLGQKRHWAEALGRLCGQDDLDFQLALLAPMIESIDSVEQQNRLWESAFERFRRRHDLAAEIRMRQAAMWEAAGNLENARRCYEDVIHRYANAGRFAVTALRQLERLLQENDREDHVIPLYRQVWSKIDPPPSRSAPFARQSNWYRVGRRLAQLHEAAGNTREAERVTSRLNAGR